MLAHLPSLLDRINRHPLARAVWCKTSLSEMLLLWSVSRNDPHAVGKHLWCRAETPLSSRYAHLCLIEVLLRLETAPGDRAATAILDYLLDFGARLQDPLPKIVHLNRAPRQPAVLRLLQTHDFNQDHATGLFCLLGYDSDTPFPSVLLHCLLDRFELDIYSLRPLSHMLFDSKEPSQAEFSPWNTALLRAPSEMVSRLLEIAPRLPTTKECVALLTRSEPLDWQILYQLDQAGVQWSDLLLVVGGRAIDPPARRQALLETLAPQLVKAVNQARLMGEASTQARILVEASPGPIAASTHSSRL